MKKILLFASVIAGLLLAGSCQREEFAPASEGAVVTYSVGIPEVATKVAVVDDGSNINDLVYAVYRTTAASLEEVDSDNMFLVYQRNPESQTFVDGETVVTIELVNDQNYVVLFWAQVNDAWVKGTDFDLTSITSPTTMKANNSTLAAFAGIDFVEKIDAPVSKSVELTRPFAQINIGTTLPTNFDVALKQSEVKVKGAGAKFNMLTQKAEDNIDVAFAFAELPDGNITVNNQSYKYAAMNYIFANGNVEVTYDIETSHGTVNNTVPAVPVEKNYRTNIIGNLLTSNAEYSVTLDKEWGTPEKVVEVITDGLVKHDNGVYEIYSANGLAYASQNLFTQGGTFVLAGDVDMSGASSVVVKAEGLTYNSPKLTYTMSNRSFELDGNGHTIKNLPGMLIAYTGSAKSVVVKNLTLETPNIAYNVEDTPETDGVGAFIGYAGTSETITLDNCHVKGGKVEGGHWTGGLVGYAAGYSGTDGPVFETLTIKDCSVKNATITGKGSCGGIIGHATGDAWTLVDMDGIDVTSNTIKSTGDDDNKAGSVMGTVGNAGQPKTVNGVTKTGGITIDNYEVVGNKVESNTVANTKLWGRQGNSDGVLTLDGYKVEDFGSYTEPASEFTYENGVYTLTRITESAVADILSDATTNHSGTPVTIQLSDNQLVTWETGAGIGSTPLAHDAAVTIKGGTFVATGSGVGSIRTEVDDKVSKLTFDGVTIVDESESYAENSWEYGYLEFTGETEFISCNFVNAVMMEGTSAKFTDCTFNSNRESEYDVWVSNGSAEFYNCTFAGYRGLKTHEAYSSEVSSITVDNCTFGPLSKKPGVAVGTLNDGTSVEIKNSTFINCQPGDQKMYIYETDSMTPTIKNSKVINDGVEVLAYDENGYQVVNVSNDSELAQAIKLANGNRVIALAAGTYSGDINLTVAELGGAKGDLVFKAAEGAEPVIAGTVTLGYRNQGTGNAMWNGIVTFEGITFNHAEDEKHSLDVQDVESLTLKNCKIVGDGEYGIGSARGNGTGASKIEYCTFTNAGMQLLGNFATGLVIDHCTFNESCINVQAGNGVTVQNSTFNNTLKSANVDDSFYLVRSNSTPITVKNCKINIGSELTEVAASQAEWGILWNRGTTNWTVEDVAVTMTEDALKQTELLVTKLKTTGVINITNLTVNGKAYASTAAQLTSAVQNGATAIWVEGEIKMPGNGTSNAITFTSNGKGYINIRSTAPEWPKATLTFENINFKTDFTQPGSNYSGLYTYNMTCRNCNFEGPMLVGRDGAKFIECTFNNLGNDYIRTYGNICSFERCTFNSDGKAILIYSDGNGKGKSPAVSVTGCTFIASTGAKAGAIANQNCAAIEIDNYGCGVALTTSENTVNPDFSGEWRIKTYYNGKGNAVKVNGTEYTTLALDGKTMTIDADKNVTVQ